MFSAAGTRVFFFFFFSSRRRHTRCSRDWSSDVCSSDLAQRRQFPVERSLPDELRQAAFYWELTPLGDPGLVWDGMVRSEERRVGKEGRCRWSTYPLELNRQLCDTTVPSPASSHRL